jgi:hypothetical protein
MVKRITETEAIKLYIMPRKNGITYGADPPASLSTKARRLPFYKERYYKTGFLLRTEGELLTWIEGVVDLRKKIGK